MKSAEQIVRDILEAQGIVGARYMTDASVAQGANVLTAAFTELNLEVISIVKREFEEMKKRKGANV